MAPGWMFFKGQEGVFFCSIAPCVSQMWMADSIRVPLEAFLSCRLCPSKGRVGFWSRSPCGQFTLTTQTLSSAASNKSLTGELNSVLPNIISKVWSAKWKLRIFICRSGRILRDFY